MPCRCTTSKSNPDSRRRDCAFWPVGSVKLRIHFNASWSVLIVNRWPSKHGCKKRTALSIARLYRLVVSCGFSASVREWYQSPIGLVVSSGCFCSETQLTWTFHASVSSVMCPPGKVAPVSAETSTRS